MNYSKEKKYTIRGLAKRGDYGAFFLSISMIDKGDFCLEIISERDWEGVFSLGEILST